MQRNAFFSFKKKNGSSLYKEVQQKEDKLKDSQRKEGLDASEIKLEENSNNTKDAKSTNGANQDGSKKSGKKKDAKMKLMQNGLDEGKKVSIDANSLLRRWDVKFLDIKVENLQKENINIFLVFKIGVKSKFTQHRRGEQILKDADIVDNGKSYKQFKTEIIKDIEKESKEKVMKFFETEIHSSYNMLRQRSLLIEVWEYSRWSLNKYLGKYEVKLEQIAEGSINQVVDVKRAGKNASFLRLFFTCYFQEIWDFRLEFEDLKGFNTINDSRKAISSYLRLSLIGDDGEQSSLRTGEQQNTLNPTYGSIPDFVHFRGTLDDLTDMLLQFTLVEANNLPMINNEGRKAIIALRGIHKFNNLSASIKIKVNKKKINLNQNKSNSQNPNETEENTTEGELNEEEVYTQVEGRVNLNLIPRYIQQGELVRYKKQMHHLCVSINRVTHISAPDDRGLINSYLVVQCANETKQTRTVKDQMNPDFNEDMVFKIPIAKSSSIFDKVNIIQTLQTENEIDKESLRDELAKRSEVRFQLWVEGNQITSDDNLGFSQFNIADLAQSYQLEDKEVIDFDTKKRVTHKIQVGNFTKNFTSSRFDASSIQVQFSVFFLPPLPPSIDLRDFTKNLGDTYPYELKDRMKIVNNNYSVNPSYEKWEKQIKDTFKQWHLKKNEIANFLKSVWVKDHYNRVHFICKFLDQFTIQDTSFETEDLEQEDTVLETFDDLAHYTRCIPYIESDYNDIWYAPDFFLQLRRGTVVDHALLLACLFMGVKEKQELKENGKGVKDEFSIQDRVFVCLGTNQLENMTAWVLVFDKSFEFLTFWDVRENRKWELKGRVEKDQIFQLKAFLNPDYKKEKKSKIGLFGLVGLDKQERETIKKEKEEQKKLDEIKRKEEEEEQERIRQEQQREEEEMKAQQQEVQNIVQSIQREPKVENNTSKNQGAFSVLEKDNSIKSQQIFSVNDVLNGNSNSRRTQVKNITDVRATMANNSTITNNNNKNTNKPTNISTLKPSELPAPEVGSKTVTFNVPPSQNGITNSILDRKTFSKAQNDSVFGKKSFLDAHKEEMIRNQDQGELTRFKKIEEFPLDDPEEMASIPFKSLQIMFNHKNVYANLANQNPIAIFYNLHDPKKWQPYIENYSQKLGTFFVPQNPYPKMPMWKGDQILEKIISDIKDGVNNIRSNEAMQTQWKSVLDPTSKLLRHYTRILEHQDKGRSMKVRDPKDKNNYVMQNQDELYAQFEKDMKNLMPLDYHFQCLPMKFLFIEKSQIRALIEEKAKSFFLLKKKHMIFGINGKIFRYPNKVNCLRVVIGIFYSNLDGMDNDADKDKLNKYKDGNQIDELSEEHEDLLDSYDNMEEEVEDDKKSKKSALKKKNGK